MFRAVGLSRAQATHSPRSLGDRERVVDAGQPERTEVVVYASEAGPSDSRCPGWVRLRARGSQPPLHCGLEECFDQLEHDVRERSVRRRVWRAAERRLATDAQMRAAYTLMVNRL